jgi:hypothetical protein
MHFLLRSAFPCYLSRHSVADGGSSGLQKTQRPSTGTPAQEASKSDLDQAERELMGKSDTDPNEAVLESAPESERWDPVSGSTGDKVPEAPSADEDEEGRSDNERLVEEGIEGAEHDQMRQASLKRDT